MEAAVQNCPCKNRLSHDWSMWTPLRRRAAIVLSVRVRGAGANGLQVEDQVALLKKFHVCIAVGTPNR
eukprot:8914395-Pyramimonas_sp.AAC.1